MAPEEEEEFKKTYATKFVQVSKENFRLSKHKETFDLNFLQRLHVNLNQKKRDKMTSHISKNWRVHFDLMVFQQSPEISLLPTP